MLSKTAAQRLNNFLSQHHLLDYKKREIILYADDSSDYIYYLKEGYVKVFKISEDGEELTLTILKPDDFFPITFGINKTTNNMYLQALTPLSLWRIPQQSFLDFIKTNPDIFYEITDHALIRYDGLLKRMEYLITGKAYTKVAATLFICAKRFGEVRGDDVIVQLPLTHRDISSLVGITRETTSLEMKKLEKRGLVTHQGRFIVVKDIRRLEEESLLESEEEMLLQNSL